ncbi:MAG: hypothetical protein K2X39_05130 [Silvanigrellaceae bacterium]|nr:hypothetical protein [Silvanigrellaceae bacterium]
MFEDKNEAKEIKQSDLVSEIQNNTENNLKRRFKNISVCGTGVTMPEGVISQIALSFNTHDLFTKEELRFFIIAAAEDLLHEVKMNNRIQSSLKNYSFQIEDVRIIVYNKNKDGHDVIDPNISIADISQGILTFRTMNPKMPHQIKTHFTETYKEAKKTIGDQ